MSIRTSVPRCSKGMFRVLRDPFFSLYGCSEFPILLCRGDLSWDSDGSRRLERLWSFCGLAPPHVMPLGGTQHDSGRSTKPRQKEGCIMTQRRNASNGLVPMCVCVCVCVPWSEIHSKRRQSSYNDPDLKRIPIPLT